MSDMKITKSIISREEAMKISPDYVKFVEGDFDLLFSSKIDKVFSNLRKNQKVLTFVTTKTRKDWTYEGIFVLAKVSSINRDCFQAVDGPVVRVTNGEYSWRVDGDRYAYPIKDKS